MNEENKLKTIDELRKENNLKKKDLADILGISKQSYCNKEKGRRKFNTYEAIKISVFFSVPIDTIKNFLKNSPQSEYHNDLAS